MKLIEVVAAVIKNQNKILITKRKHKLFNGLWEFPGGKIENNETHEQALKREIKEELNIDIDVGKFIVKVEYQYPEFYLVMHTYESTITNGQINLDVHSDFKWITHNELDKFEWVPADIQIINKIKEASN